jgi:hypothetical protein
MRCLSLICLTLSLTISADGTEVLADDTETLIVNDDFEKWEWKPIDFNQRRDGRNRLKAGRVLPFEHRGPLLRIARGFTLPSGRLIEGDESFDGSSTRLEDTQVGLHGRYSSIIRPAATYRYEVALKGQGTFHFRAWAGAKHPLTGKFRWLGFPDLIKVDVTDKWQVYRGTFQMPEFQTAGFQLPEKISAAIVVKQDDKVDVDEFRVWEFKKKTRE